MLSCRAIKRLYKPCSCAGRNMVHTWLAQCTEHNCRKQTYILHSCGHRNCPHCQNHENQQWIENQLGKRLPVRYYLITFTLPEQLRDLAWRHQKKIYSLMFACVSDVLKTFTRNDRKLGGMAGFPPYCIPSQETLAIIRTFMLSFRRQAST